MNCLTDFDSHTRGEEHFLNGDLRLVRCNCLAGACRWGEFRSTRRVGKGALFARRARRARPWWACFALPTLQVIALDRNPL
jgi:hypothetical protein